MLAILSPARFRPGARPRAFGAPASRFRSSLRIFSESQVSIAGAAPERCGGSAIVKLTAETTIRGDPETVWRLTQTPDQHVRWGTVRG